MSEAREYGRLLGVIGLCARAGALVYGTDRVCTALRNPPRGGEIRLVIEAEGCSQNTHKKITDKCNFYNIEHRMLPVSSAELGAAVGKTGELAVAGITDENLCLAVKKQLDAIR